MPTPLDSEIQRWLSGQSTGGEPQASNSWVERARYAQLIRSDVRRLRIDLDGTTPTGGWWYWGLAVWWTHKWKW